MCKRYFTIVGRTETGCSKRNGDSTQCHMSLVLLLQQRVKFWLSLQVILFSRVECSQAVNTTWPHFFFKDL